jgi:putative ATP-dependent endonuclease of OLD family
MSDITKIKQLNFKKFDKFEVDFDPKLNLLIGENEASKSAILTAIDLAISGSRNKVETIGLEHLFNVKAIPNFLLTDRKLENLPILFVELFLHLAVIALPTPPTTPETVVNYAVCVECCMESCID